LINNPNNTSLNLAKFIDKGRLEDKQSFENLMTLSVQKAILDPIYQKQERPAQEIEMIDFSELNPDMGKRNYKIRNQCSEIGLPLNVTFTEPAVGCEPESIMDNRETFAEYCFE
jgi:hypothetical protein